MHELVVLDIEASNLKNLAFANSDRDTTFVCICVCLSLFALILFAEYIIITKCFHSLHQYSSQKSGRPTSIGFGQCIAPNLLGFKINQAT
jgi:hypothetical protein